jgi:hypothetical protein
VPPCSWTPRAVNGIYATYRQQKLSEFDKKICSSGHYSDSAISSCGNEVKGHDIIKEADKIKFFTPVFDCGIIKNSRSGRGRNREEKGLDNKDALKAPVN